MRLHKMSEVAGLERDRRGLELVKAGVAEDPTYPVKKLPYQSPMVERALIKRVLAKPRCVDGINVQSLPDTLAFAALSGDVGFQRRSPQACINLALQVQLLPWLPTCPCPNVLLRGRALAEPLRSQITYSLLFVDNGRHTTELAWDVVPQEQRNSSLALCALVHSVGNPGADVMEKERRIRSFMFLLPYSAWADPALCDAVVARLPRSLFHIPQAHWTAKLCALAVKGDKSVFVKLPRKFQEQVPVLIAGLTAKR